MPSERTMERHWPAGFQQASAILRGLWAAVPSHMPLSLAEYHKHVQNRKVHPPATVYKYVTSSTAAKILANKTLQWGSPLTFNDPLDGQWDVFWPLYTQEAIAYESERLRDLLLCKVDIRAVAAPKAREVIWADRRRLLALPKDKREERVDEIVRESRESADAVRDRFAPRRNDIIRRGRVFCVCEDPLQTPMWAHYANNHTGVVLAFDSNLLEAGWNAPFEQVKYVESFPELINHKVWSDFAMGFGPPPKWEHERDWLLYKKSSWSYEKEWRIAAIAPRGITADRKFVEIPGASVTRIIFGQRITEEEASGIRAAARRLFPQVLFTRVAVQPNTLAFVEVDAQ